MAVSYTHLDVYKRQIYYLNTGEIPSTATAPGLEEARERLELDSMTKDELAAYYRHLDNIVILRVVQFAKTGRGEPDFLNHQCDGSLYRVGFRNGKYGN